MDDPYSDDGQKNYNADKRDPNNLIIGENANVG